ncbi:MAG TPA: hypothetical protein VGJ44_08000 [Kribbellaceae bacterium]
MTETTSYDEFWTGLAASIRTGAADGQTPLGAPEQLGLAERYERLYSASARMLTAQGSRTWHGDRWPAERRQAWSLLEIALLDDRLAGLVSAAPDPARHLAASARPTTFAAAVEWWNGRLAAEQPTDPIVVVPGPLHTQVAVLLAELAARLAPGRPVAAVGDDAAGLSAAVHELADLLRAPLTGTGTPHPAEAVRVVRGPEPLGFGPALPTQLDRLTAAASQAAAAIPVPDELDADFAVRREAATAAADLRTLLEDPGAPGWRERQPGIRPESHLVSGYQWNGDAGRPLPFADQETAVRSAISAVRPPWRPTSADPEPEPSPRQSWVVLPAEAALAAANLLDELAARLIPGRWSGTIHYRAYPLQDFIAVRLPARFREI